MFLGFLAWQGYAHLKNCPGVKMDGNNDGVPCEKQWCK